MTEIKKRRRQLIYKLIGLAFMLFFQFIPIQSKYITKLGLQVIGVFIGTLLQWSVGNIVWPSILAVVLLGYYGYMPMGAVLSNWMGNPTLVMIFFLLILIGGFQYHKCTLYIARFFTSLKIMERRPWVFTFTMLLGTYLMAAFVNPWAGVFLFLPIVQGICLEIGFSKTDLYTKSMTIGIIMMALLGFPSTYYNGTVLGLNTTFSQASDGLYVMPGGPYMLVGVVLGLISTVLITLVIRFIIKPNVNPLKDLTIERINKNSLPSMKTGQKIMFIGVGIFIILMIVPAIAMRSKIADFVTGNLQGIGMTIVAILAMINIEGEPVLDLPKVIASNFSWETYLLIGTSITLGQALTDKSVGFTDLLDKVLNPLFTNMSPTIFFVSIILVSVILTNVLNSAVYVLIVHPIILTFANINGINPLPIVMLVTYTSLGLAAILPSASPYAATIYGQSDYLTAKDIYKYTSLFVIAEVLLILIVGLPLVLAVF